TTRCRHPTYMSPMSMSSYFFSTATPTSYIYTLSLHDALPILFVTILAASFGVVREADHLAHQLGEPYGTLILTLSIVLIEVILRSEEHTSELQSRFDLVCRLLLEKKKKAVAT